MAGKPGMKGGGGARPGSGRKPKEKQVEKLNLSSVMAAALTHKDPKAFLLAVMNDAGSEGKMRVDAAKALMPFMHQKIGEGIKDAKQDAAKKAGAGKFGAAAPPRLVSSRA